MDFENFHSKIKIYLTFNVKARMKCNINMLVLVLLITYFYYTKVFQILYSTHKTQWKHEGFHNDFIKKIEPTFLCLC
jgi:hypothetical protein